jgi:hypothetical protein
MRDTDGEERRLLAEYDAAAQNFSWAVRELSRHREDVLSAEFQELLELTEKARVECRRTRKAFEEHLQKSGPPT